MIFYGYVLQFHFFSPSFRLEAFEMRLLIKMFYISWVELACNTNVIHQTNTKRALLTTIKCWKIAYLGHVLTGEQYRLLQVILKSKIEGRRGIDWHIRCWTAFLYRRRQNDFCCNNRQCPGVIKLDNKEHLCLILMQQKFKKGKTDNVLKKENNDETYIKKCWVGYIQLTAI